MQYPLYVSYYPFGMLMPERKNNFTSYRFGFNKSLMDNEIYGNANCYSTYWRQLDPRLGRWWQLSSVRQAHKPPAVLRGHCWWRRTSDNTPPGRFKINSNYQYHNLIAIPNKAATIIIKGSCNFLNRIKRRTVTNAIVTEIQSLNWRFAKTITAPAIVPIACS